MTDGFFNSLGQKDNICVYVCKSSQISELILTHTFIKSLFLFFFLLKTLLFLYFCLFKEDSRRENKENQWMGVTISSQGPGGKVLVRVLNFWNMFLKQFKSVFHYLYHFLFLADLCPSLHAADKSKLPSWIPWHYRSMLYTEPGPNYRSRFKWRRRKLAFLCQPKQRPWKVWFLPAGPLCYIWQGLPLLHLWCSRSLQLER